MSALIRSVISDLYESRCASTVAPRRNGLDITPNGTRQNLNSCIVFSSTLEFLGSLSHRNRVTSRSLFWRPTCKNAFSISDTIPMSYNLNRIRIPHKSCSSTGPRYKHSFRLLFSFLVLAEASYTILSFVVVLSGVITT